MFQLIQYTLEQPILDIVKALVSYIAMILAVHVASNVRYKVHILLYWQLYYERNIILKKHFYVHAQQFKAYD